MLSDFKNILDKTQFSIPPQKSINLEDWTMTVKNLLKKTKKIYIIGNGASCSMASHFATDFTKNCGIPSESLNDGALLTCYINDYSFRMSYIYMLIDKKINNKDLLIAISSSGNSENIVNAVQTCYTEGINVLTFSGFSKENLIRPYGYGCYVPANTYGMVESAHAYFIHAILDEIEDVK